MIEWLNDWIYEYDDDDDDNDYDVLWWSLDHG